MPIFCLFPFAVGQTINVAFQDASASCVNSANPDMIQQPMDPLDDTIKEILLESQ